MRQCALDAALSLAATDAVAAVTASSLNLRSSPRKKSAKQRCAAVGVVMHEATWVCILTSSYRRLLCSAQYPAAAVEAVLSAATGLMYLLLQEGIQPLGRGCGP